MAAQAALAGAADRAASELTEQPNVVLILADDLGYGDLGCYGNARNRTPHLDRLAREGLKFTDFHSNGPMCSPTRAALLTGRYQQRMGIETALGEHSQGLDPDEITIAERLRDAGYATGIFGKWHLGPQPSDAPVHHGFQEFRGHLHGAVDYISHVDRYGRVDWYHNDRLANEEGYNTTLITEHAVRFIESHRNQPFLLYVPHSAIHFPWMTARDDAHREPGQRYDQGLVKLGPHEHVRPVVQEMIEALDRSVGRIVQTLQRLDIDRRTLVFFTSDNGGYLHYADRHQGDISSNGVLRGQKQDVYEGGHRVPAIAWWPGRIQPGTIKDTTAMTMDLFPTLLRLANLEPPQADSQYQVDGISLVGTLLRGDPLPQRTLFWRIRQEKAVRCGPWKLVVSSRHPPELYNLADDLGETINLAASQPDRVTKLQEKLAEWERSVKAQ
jgi:arylsulfatase A-like enzyme